MTNPPDHKIRLNGHIDVPVDRMAAVEAALPTHIKLSREETGCVSFEVLPSETVKGRFMVAETFINRASFDAHQARTKNSDWFKVTQDIPREYSIKVGEE